jgi:hypothetical protein
MRIVRPVAIILVSFFLICLAHGLLPPMAGAAEAPLLAWETSFDSYPEMGGNGYDVMHDVVPTDDGGAVAAGYATPPGSYSPGGKPQQAFLVRLDAFGTEVWRTYLGEATNDPYEVRRIRRTADGGFVVACVAWTPFDSESGGMYYNTSFVAKLDGAGAEQWRYRMDPLLLDEVGDVDVLADGSVVAAGRVWTYGGGTSTAVAKISSTGSLLWLRKELPDYIGNVGRIAATQDGGFFATSGGGLVQTLARYAPDGSYLWSVVIGELDGEIYLNEKDIHGITVKADGGCIVAGAVRYNYFPIYGPFRPFLATFDALGHQTATLVVPTVSKWVHAVERLADGGLVAAEGVEGSNTGIVFIRYDRMGNELWRTNFGVPPPERYIHAIRVTGEGALVAAGAIRGTGTWAPMDGYVMMTEGMYPPGIGAKIDVRPGSEDNPVNCGASGLLPVALLSSADFEATRVDPATITLEGAPVDRIGKERFHAVSKDVDGDGRFDLLLFFSIPSLNLSPTTTQVTLNGTAPDGRTFSASDDVRIVGDHSRSRNGVGTLLKGKHPAK